jgi:hypothetical protein
VVERAAVSVRWPAVAASLVRMLPGLPGWASVAVSDGPPTQTDRLESYCSVGYVRGEESAGDWAQAVGTVDGLLEETGTVRCDLVQQSAVPELAPQLRVQAFVLTDQLDAALRADPTLGGALRPDGTVALTGDVVPVQNTSGSAVRLVLTVNYFTRTE